MGALECATFDAMMRHDDAARYAKYAKARCEVREYVRGRLEPEYHSLTKYNDTCGRTQAEVLGLVDSAIRDLEIRAAGSDTQLNQNTKEG